MTLLLITGKGGETAPDTAHRDVARAQQLARHVDDLVVLEADETWWTPFGARKTEISSRPGPVDLDPDVRRSSLALVLRETARREPGTVVLLLDADLDQVKRIHPVSQRLGLPLLWWREEPPSGAVVAQVSQSIAGVLTSWTDDAAVPGWLWSVGAGIDLRAVPVIETFPTRPPLRLLAWAPTGERDLHGVLQALAFARGLTADVHLTIALTDPGAPNGARHEIEARIRNLALTRSAHIAVVDGPGSFPGFLAQAHALVDLEGPDHALTLETLLAMAHGRPVLSSRKQFAKLLETAPLPLRFAPGDERQLADRMKSLAAAWGEELDSVGQALRNAVRQEHSVIHWAQAVASIVGFVRSGRHGANEPVASEPGAEVVAFTGNSSSAPSPPSEQPEPDASKDAPNGEGGAEIPSDNSSGDATVGASRRRRRRVRRSGNH
jgi:hypothetical protein